MKQVASAGFTKGSIGDFPGRTADNQQATTTVRYGSDRALAELVQQTLGFGEVQQDDEVADGHVLVVVGRDRVPSGLRGAGVAFAPTRAQPRLAALASAPACVN